MSAVLTGLIPACHTPFDCDGELNLAVVERQAALFRETGLRAVFIAGTTGEFASLTVDERKALCERWVEVAGDSIRVAVHIGHNCLGDAIELAAHARQAGVAAVALAPPSYFKPTTIQDLVDLCAPIAAEVDPLPFYYYHIPGMTGVRLPMAEFLYEARFRIPNLRGLKFSHDDLVDLQGCVALENGAYDVFNGFDEALLAGLCLGVRGAVGATYNFAGRHYLKLIRAFESGDMLAARAAQLEATEMVKALASFGFMAASKAVMSLMGIDCGPVRPPIRNLAPAQLDALVGKLSDMNIFARPLKLLV
jgi:N-acetylneuraminate lyase